jgi:hypothetical protein
VVVEVFVFFSCDLSAAFERQAFCRPPCATAMAQHLEKHLATCPCVDEMKKEVDYLCKIKPGDPEKPLGRPVSATAEIDEKMNNCIT